SSRRRHTRFSRDWSSDVCSSDLRVRGHQLVDPCATAIIAELLVDRRRGLTCQAGVLEYARYPILAMAGDADLRGNLCPLLRISVGEDVEDVGIPRDLRNGQSLRGGYRLAVGGRAFGDADRTANCGPQVERGILALEVREH